MSRVVGHPIIWAPFESLDLGGFHETVHEKALDRMLAGNADVLALFAHDRPGRSPGGAPGVSNSNGIAWASWPMSRCRTP